MREFFGDIESIWLIVAPVALLIVAILGERKRRMLLDLLVSHRLVPDMVHNLSPGRRRWKTALRVVAALLIATAVMRPQWGARKVDVVKRGIDIVFLVDTSKSMLAEDVTPNRMERVKRDIRHFVDNVVLDDRIALVGFAGTARTLCPLTLDRGAFNLFLDELDVGVIPRGGTDLASALEEGLDAFGDDLRNHKAIILFSDGEAHEGVPEVQLEEARKLGVRIYTIGIGSEKGVQIPVTNENGQRTHLKDHEGNIVLTRLDDRMLKTVAQRSLDGAYTHLASGRKNVERIYLDNIAKIEERELRSKKQVRKLERYQWFLALALGLLMLESIIADGERTGRRAPVTVPEETTGVAKS